MKQPSRPKMIVQSSRFPLEWSLHNRFVVLVLTVVLLVLGLGAARTLPIGAVPDITNVQAQVLTKAPALGPLEVERFVSVPVERAMSGLPQVIDLRSVSKFGLSQVTVVFEDGADIFRGRQLVAERLQEARDAIPQGYGTPELAPLSTGLGEVYEFEVRGAGPHFDGAAVDPRGVHLSAAQECRRRGRDQHLRRRASDLSARDRSSSASEPSPFTARGARSASTFATGRQP